MLIGFRRGPGRARQAGREGAHDDGLRAKGTSADTFVLTNTEAKGPKTIGIVESKENLAPHVGHVIAITGTDVPAKDSESAKPTPPKADHYMKVTSIKMVSTTCK